jgi:hypothetical protein
VAAFIRNLQDTHSGDFEYLETIIKGNMLANAIFLPDPSQAQRKFRKTEIFFDTSFLMYALGHAGEARKAPCTELLELIYEGGGELRFFRHTLNEARGALDACALRIARGETRESYGPSMEYFLTMGYRASDIELFSISLERDLANMRVKIVDRPSYEREFVIDEPGLTEALKKEIHYRTPQPLVRDVESIAAIMRLRRGLRTIYVEECRAVFVTTNSGLAKVARDFLADELGHGSVAPAVTDYAMTNLLWLKRALEAPDLPRKRVIADCYAATQPEEHLWKKYLVEIEKLEAAGQVNREDVFILRHSIEAKSALMDLTLGEEQAFTQGTVTEILQLIHEQRYSSFKQEIEQQKGLLRTAQGALASSDALEVERSARIQRRAQKTAKGLRWGIEGLAIILLFVGSAYTFPWSLPPIKAAWFGYSLSVVWVAMLVLSVANLMYGTAVESYLRRIEVCLADRIEKAIKAFVSFIIG